MGKREARITCRFWERGRWLSCLLLLACGPQSPREVVEEPSEQPAVSLPSGQEPPAEEPSSEPPPDEPAPAEESPSPVPEGRSWYVSTKGRDDAAGTRQAPLRTVGRALVLARPTEVIRVLSGVYAEEFILESRGSGAAALTIQGEGSPLPTFVPRNKERSTVVRVQGRWNLRDIRVDVGGEPMFAIVFESGSDGSSLSGSELRSGTSSGGVLVEGARGLTLEGNSIHHFIKPNGDSHGVVVVGPSRDIVIRSNDIHHNSGDSIQCQAGSGPATGLLIERNTLHDEGENGVDIKQCQDITIRANTITSLPNAAIRSLGSSAGEAVVIHLAARRVTVEGNTIARTGRGVSILEDAAPPEDIRVEGNHLENIRDLPEGNGFGIRVEGGRRVVVVGNTVVDAVNYALMVAADGKSVTGLEVRDNILRGRSSAPLVRLGAASYRPGLVLRGNQYSLGGVLKADGVLSLLVGALSSFREDFPGERLTLSAPEKLEVWRRVMGLDAETVLVE
jgi:nitrous oxidase accessory protein NosD